MNPFSTIENMKSILGEVQVRVPAIILKDPLSETPSRVATLDNRVATLVMYPETANEPDSLTGTNTNVSRNNERN